MNTFRLKKNPIQQANQRDVPVNVRCCMGFLLVPRERATNGIIRDQEQVSPDDFHESPLKLIKAMPRNPSVTKYGRYNSMTIVPCCRYVEQLRQEVGRSFHKASDIW
eukprot:CAMPEP_0116856268 /NCGR_PEP_ID=MMETSP0418-20121206/19802_1 /TAXON_ID=1158023 /ORGANISM="Astrosyne radiata, Strain 13vi08-1A" /LENGTH=106 /DNA_ID=CAMNT_0004489619 /DNA_START=19 /DNA_END=336 /DNA_ORIENTATION=+